MKKILTTTMIVASGMAPVKAQKTMLRLTPDNIDEVVKAMTLHEKALLCVGTHRASDTTQGGKYADVVQGVAGATIAIPRLGIPLTLFGDGPAGLRISPTRANDSRTYYCTHFPIGTCQASSWDINLVKEVGAAIGDEAHRYGVDVLLAPGMNIMRNPLCGRNYEYYSEDPVLSGNIAAAYVNGVQSQGVGTSIKHFAFNNQETRRFGNDAIVSQRAAREIYLKNFEIAIKKSNPWTVMSAYNLVNDVMTSEREDLLTGILRDEWGYRGMVVTDCGGGRDPVRRPYNSTALDGLTAISGLADRLANIRAGNDLIEPGSEDDVKTLEDAVNNGSLDEKCLDESVRRILEYIVKTPRFNHFEYHSDPDLTAHAIVTRNAAAEGTVLLKNNGMLPIDDARLKAVYGVGSYRPVAGGTGSGDVNSRYLVSLVKGMQTAGFAVDDAMTSLHDGHLKAHDELVEKMNIPFWLPKPLAEELVPTDRELERAAADDDFAVITLCRLSGEGKDRLPSDFYLSDKEKLLIAKVADAFHRKGKQVAVVLNVGGVIETTSWKDMPDAILLPWQCGQEFGISVALLLAGRLTPSGKLPMTWPVDYKDAASTKNFPPDRKGTELSGNKTIYKDVRNVGYTLYEEGIYTLATDTSTLSIKTCRIPSDMASATLILPTMTSKPRSTATQ